ncbi:MAG TPA: DUF3160 domain-containing protein [Myxococcaceae bacterium]
MRRLLLTLTCLLWGGLASAASFFDTPEPTLTPSPGKAARLELVAGEQLVASAVSPLGPEVALAVRAADGGSRVVLWKIGEAKTVGAWPAPAGTSVEALAWHPAQRRVFAVTRQGKRSAISLLEPRADGTFARTEVHGSERELRGLIVGARPFMFPHGKEQREVKGYRLFFGVRHPGGFAVHTMTELGTREYLVAGPKALALQPPDMEDYSVPSPIDVPSALPLALHPNGKRLLFRQERGVPRAIDYQPAWEETKDFSVPATAVGFLPNGLGLLLWEPGKPGAQGLISMEKQPRALAPALHFLAPPSVTGDGRGLVGVVRGERATVVYEPVTLPLADVLNAWRLVDSGKQLEHLGRHSGFFQPTGSPQLYNFYEWESYRRDTWESSPYLVTTDGFWELFAAAYEGSFILAERQLSMPRFWDFVREAHRDAKKLGPGWAVAFAALESLRTEPQPGHPEAQRILAAKGPERSEALNEPFDYGDLKPRSHYTTSEDLRRYFQAMRYLTSVSRRLDAAALAGLPSQTQALARAWIASYAGYIAPSRAPTVWSKSEYKPPPYLRKVLEKPVLFPLSWGFDNEVLFTNVFHCDTPLPQRMQRPVRPGERVDADLLAATARCEEGQKEPQVPRLLPSGLDVAAALGSKHARGLMKAELELFPPLGPALEELGARFNRYVASQGAANLYDRWLRGLALQWADDVAPPPGVDATLWKTKRLQTGLASWATLRHVTLLVNERSGAEMGEGGEFEEVFPEQPRGYVEPDPQTFEAIAQLFEATAERFREASASLGDTPIQDRWAREQEVVRTGVLKRLQQSAAAVREFKVMAQKQLRGEPLTPKEYVNILYVGRNFEHNYLVFKSLGHPKLALSDPQPISKIADVADAGPKPLLHAAVGSPLEWRLVVPHLGRRQLVRGAVYAYYELINDEPLSDEEWRQREEKTPRPAWVTPFLVEK